VDEDLGLAVGVDVVKHFFMQGFEQPAVGARGDEQPLLAGDVVRHVHHVDRDAPQDLEYLLQVAQVKIAVLGEHLTGQGWLGCPISVAVLETVRPHVHLENAGVDVADDQRAPFRHDLLSRLAHAHEAGGVLRVWQLVGVNACFAQRANQGVVEHIVVHAILLGHAPADLVFIIEVGILAVGAFGQAHLVVCAGAGGDAAHVHA